MAMSSIMSYLGGFICWTSPSFTVRVCGQMSVFREAEMTFPHGLFSPCFISYLPVFGFNDDFVAAALSDLDLDVGLFLIRDPGSLLACRRSQQDERKSKQGDTPTFDSTLEAIIR